MDISDRSWYHRPTMQRMWWSLKNLRRRFERFCFQNRNKGISNLTLYIAIGTFLVTLLYNLGNTQIFSLLSFNYTKILQGQVWRLVTFIFTMPMDVFTSLIFLYCCTSLGKTVENAMGTFKFNLYYLSGVLLMDIFGMMFGGFTWVLEGGQFLFVQLDCSALFSGNMAFFLYLSLILCFATLHPDAQFLLLYLIPIKAWILALFYFIYLIYQIVAMATNPGFYPQCFFPLIGLANYFLFFGKDAGNLIPMSWRVKANRASRKSASHHQGGTIPFSSPQPKKESAPAYTHRCTVCGRTDVTNPEVEFRYCSRCNGYFCYCQDHISNHTHVE